MIDLSILVMCIAYGIGALTLSITKKYRKFTRKLNYPIYKRGNNLQKHHQGSMVQDTIKSLAFNYASNHETVQNSRHDQKHRNTPQYSL